MPRPSEPVPARTLLAVHAHPDDEATSTGAILAHYSAAGVRTVVVTCTNGECGDAPGGVKPGEPGHDPAAVAATRRAELEESCRILGVERLELLGFRDSGMAGWPQNDHPEAFSRLAVRAAVERLVPLLERYRPDVVVTYDADGFYGHPDHVQAHRVTVAALGAVASPARLFCPVIPSSARRRFLELVASDAGQELGDEIAEQPEVQFRSMDYPDDDLAAAVDCRLSAKTAFAALAAHQSQGDNLFMLRGGPDRFAEWFGVQAFASGRGDGPPRPGEPLDDLFAGLDGGD
jgi:LmbE family N-acetylglucosaminyl deacetylase